MEFDARCFLKYQIYPFRYPHLSKFFVDRLCKAPFTDPGKKVFIKPALNIHYGLSASAGGLSKLSAWRTCTFDPMNPIPSVC